MRAAVRVDLLNYGNKPLYLVGHSLGAAMASLAAPMLKYELKAPVVNLFTFGCPRTGNVVRPKLLYFIDFFFKFMLYILVCFDSKCLGHNRASVIGVSLHLDAANWTQEFRSSAHYLLVTVA